MGGLSDLWNSERGIIALVIIVAATVLCGMKIMAVSDWNQLALWIFGIFATAKTITSSVALFKGAPPQDTKKG